MKISHDDKVGTIAAKEKGAIKILLNWGIDFYCAGLTTLADASAKMQIDPDEVIDDLEINAVVDATDFIDWTTRDITFLVEHIIVIFHRILKIDLPALITFANEKIPFNNGEDLVKLKEIIKKLTQLEIELLDHMEQEEKILFPWILKGDPNRAGETIKAMEIEHRHLINLITSAVNIIGPNDGLEQKNDNLLKLATELKKIDTFLKELIHLENNILFPRALFA